MTKRRATVLTPGGHDVTSADGGSIRLTGKAEDAGTARLGAPVPPRGTLRKNNDAPDLPVPAGRVVAAGKPVAGIRGATLVLRAARRPYRQPSGLNPAFQIRQTALIPWTY
jgi:hypothetical protein